MHIYIHHIYEFKIPFSKIFHIVNEKGAQGMKLRCAKIEARKA